MSLSNLFGWNTKKETAAAAACGTACGTACGAGDKPEEKPAAEKASASEKKSLKDKLKERKSIAQSEEVQPASPAEQPQQIAAEDAPDAGAEVKEPDPWVQSFEKAHQ